MTYCDQSSQWIIQTIELSSFNLCVWVFADYHICNLFINLLKLSLQTNENDNLCLFLKQLFLKYPKPPQNHNQLITQMIMNSLTCSNCRQYIYTRCTLVSHLRKIGYAICSQCQQNGKARQFAKEYHDLVARSNYDNLKIQKEELNVKYNRCRNQLVHEREENQKINQREKRNMKKMVYNSFEKENALKSVLNHLASLKILHFDAYVNNVKAKQCYIFSQAIQIAKPAEKIIQNVQNRVTNALNQILTSQIKYFLNFVVIADLRDAETRLLKIERYVQKAQNQMRELKMLSHHNHSKEIPKDKLSERQLKEQVVFCQEQITGLKKYFQGNILQYKEKIEILQGLFKQGQAMIRSVQQSAEYKDDKINAREEGQIQEEGQVQQEEEKVSYIAK